MAAAGSAAYEPNATLRDGQRVRVVGVGSRAQRVDDRCFVRGHDWVFAVAGDRTRPVVAGEVAEYDLGAMVAATWPNPLR